MKELLREDSQMIFPETWKYTYKRKRVNIKRKNPNIENSKAIYEFCNFDNFCEFCNYLQQHNF